MKKLVSSSEAAEILGLSLQGVHYRIKKGQLKSMKKDGKTYVYVEKEQIDQFHHKQQPSLKNTKQKSYSTPSEQPPYMEDIPQAQKQLYELVYKAKEDQIADLKKNIENIKEQYKTEIYRLDKNQKQILEVFQGEIELLKSAFYEMKNVYQLEHKERMEDKKYQYSEQKAPKEEPIKNNPIKENQEEDKQENKQENQEEKIKIPFMDIKEFYTYMKSFNKTDNQIKNIILERIKAGDKRFIYKKGTKEVIIFRSDFIDLV